MKKKIALGVPLTVSLLILTACSGSKEAPTTSTPGATQGSATPQAAAPVMQPLQKGQPPQKPPKSMFANGPAVPAGNPGTTPLSFKQPFQLADLEYQFIGNAGKGFVGLAENPAKKADPGNTFLIVRYQVTDHGQPVNIPNAAAVHLMNTANEQVVDIDQEATNLNVQSGAATGMPNQLSLNTDEPQIQTLVFQLPATTDFGTFGLLVTEPKDPTHVFQLVKLSN